MPHELSSRQAWRLPMAAFRALPSLVLLACIAGVDSFAGSCLVKHTACRSSLGPYSKQRNKFECCLSPLCACREMTSTQTRTYINTQKQTHYVCIHRSHFRAGMQWVFAGTVRNRVSNTSNTDTHTQRKTQTHSLSLSLSLSHTHIYIYTNTHKHTHAHTHAYTHARKPAHTHAPTQPHTRNDTHTHTHPQSRIHTQTHT